MSSPRPLTGLVLVVCCLLVALMGVAVSGLPTWYFLSPNTLYSWEVPHINTSAPGCSDSGLYPGFCLFRYQSDLSTPAAGQPWQWAAPIGGQQGGGGIAAYGSDWDPTTDPNYAHTSHPTDGTQYAFLQCFSNGGSSCQSTMTTFVSHVAGQQYYANYTLASRGHDYSIDPSAQLALYYRSTAGTSLNPITPSANQQWSAPSNPVLSAPFTATSDPLPTLIFQLSANGDVDNTVLIDSFQLLAYGAVNPNILYGFETPDESVSPYFQYNPVTTGSYSAAFAWTPNAGGIAHSTAGAYAPWDPQGNYIPEGHQYAFIQTTSNTNTPRSSMSAPVSLLSGVTYSATWYGGYRYTGCAGLCNDLTGATLNVWIIPSDGSASTLIWSKAATDPYPSSFTAYFAQNTFSVATTQIATIRFEMASDPTTGYDRAWLIDGLRIYPQV